MNRPEPGAPSAVDNETRLSLIVDGDRELFQVEVKLGDTWQRHSAPSESFLTAVEVARRVAHRARSERPVSPMTVQNFKWPGPEPWTSEPDRHGQYNMLQLSGRIRAARARAGMRT